MSARHQPRVLTWRSRADIRAAFGVLLVLREPPAATPPSPGQPPGVPSDPAEGDEILLALADDGHALLLAGHVDLGTGLQTAYAQIAAEELDLPLEQVHVRLGDTALAPNQGPTIASTSIQLHAQPLRVAAAQARAWLVEQAAMRWRLSIGELRTEAGQVHAPNGQGQGQTLGYAELVAGQHVELLLDPATPTKPVADYRIVGSSAPRVDLLDKVTGGASFVHDVRLAGMLHGRVVRPPYVGLDAGDFVGRSLLRVDEASITQLPGIVKLVVIGDFIGIVTEREEQAEAAMRALRADWTPHTPLPPLNDLAAAISAHPSTPRVVAEHGDVAGALAGAAKRLDRDYLWPYQLHASIGPSCAVADWHGESARVWAGTQNPHALRADLAKLTNLPAAAIEVIRVEAAGCYGRNGADDVAADALLLSRAVGAPVRVQLTREQEHVWEPKGAAQWMQIKGGLDAAGAPLAYDFATSYPSNGAPTLALLLTGAVPASRQAFEMGDRTAVPPYTFPHQRITVNDMAPILRASWLRGVSALPNSFAHESYIDELAHAAGVDPVAYRLRHLQDERAAELVRATAARAHWLPHTTPQIQAPQGDWLPGQGFAYARYVHSKFPGFGAAWAAWVADVQVNRQTGEVHVQRVVVGQDAGLMVNPLGVQQQVHGNVLQTTSRALKERVALDPNTGLVESREWGSYPILNFREVPVVDVLLMPRPGEPALGVGESASVPGTAAIANAIFDATGVRLRQPPFTPEVVLAALNAADGVMASPAPMGVTRPFAPQVADPQRRPRRWWALVGALTGAVLGLGAAALGWRQAIAPVSASTAGVYSAAVIERGRQLAAIGNCVACHTADAGIANAGGRAMVTPFGTVYSTNLTPDADTGIGRWSFSAFQRAMREGVSRDGHRLYPAFPYTAFSQAGDDDLTALYAWLMSQVAVPQTVPDTRLAWPFNWRPLMGVWNALALQVGPLPAAAGGDSQWQRGAYLVNGLGHCGGCHTPRDALGAERNGVAYLGGAVIDGWQAPALGALSRSPIAWTEAAMAQYLRQGWHPDHGTASASMAEVVRGLAQASDADVAAMAHYLVSLQGPSNAASPTASSVVAQAAKGQSKLLGPAQRMFESACGACHYDGPLAPAMMPSPPPEGVSQLGSGPALVHDGPLAPAMTPSPPPEGVSQLGSGPALAHDGNGPETQGKNLPLALNSQLHSDSPDNLIRTILDGIPAPAFAGLGHMPAFRHALSDRQVAELAGWMRRRFAPDLPPWPRLDSAVRQ